MDIAELDIDDASQVEALFALELAVHAADCPDNPPPLREPFVTLLRQAHPEGRIERLVATVDGELAGAAFIALARHRQPASDLHRSARRPGTPPSRCGPRPYARSATTARCG